MSALEYGVRWTASGETTSQPTREFAEELIRAHVDKFDITNTLVSRTGPDAEWQEVAL